MLKTVLSLENQGPVAPLAELLRGSA